MFEELFDQLSDGICLSDRRGKILYLNPAAKKILELPAAPSPEKTLCEILCGRLAVDGASECVSTCELLNPDSAAGAVTLRGNHGPREVAEWKEFAVERRSVWRNLRVRCLKGSSSGIGEGNRLTIIEDTAAQAELERQKEDWRQMIAHDLRAPLTSIYATICIFQEAAGRPLPEESGPLAAAAERSCRKMLELITLYLDVAKIDAGMTEVRHAALRLAETVRTELAGQAAAVRVKRLEVVVAVPEDIRVEADPDLLSRVVQNVLDNAVKFSPFGGRVEFSARADGAQAELSIKDNGAGIAPEELPHLFDRYHMARSRRAGRIQGTGLGLTFCREALNLMRGGISVRSDTSAGTEFLIRLPLAPRDADAHFPGAR